MGKQNGSGARQCSVFFALVWDSGAFFIEPGGADVIESAENWLSKGTRSGLKCNMNIETEKKDITQYVEEIIGLYYFFPVDHSFYALQTFPRYSVYRTSWTNYYRIPEFLLVFLLYERASLRDFRAGIEKTFLARSPSFHFSDCLCDHYDCRIPAWCVSSTTSGTALVAALLCHYFFVYRAVGAEAGDLSGTTAGWLLTAIFLLHSTYPAGRDHAASRFLTSGFDLGIFDQMFYHVSKGQPPIHNNLFWTDESFDGDSFFPNFLSDPACLQVVPFAKDAVFMQCFRCTCSIPAL